MLFFILLPPIFAFSESPFVVHLAFEKPHTSENWISAELDFVYGTLGEWQKRVVYEKGFEGVQLHVFSVSSGTGGKQHSVVSKDFPTRQEVEMNLKWWAEPLSLQELVTRVRIAGEPGVKPVVLVVYHVARSGAIGAAVKKVTENTEVGHSFIIAGTPDMYGISIADGTVEQKISGALATQVLTNAFNRITGSHMDLSRPLPMPTTTTTPKLVKAAIGTNNLVGLYVGLGALVLVTVLGLLAFFAYMRHKKGVEPQNSSSETQSNIWDENTTPITVFAHPPEYEQVSEHTESADERASDCGPERRQVSGGDESVGKDMRSTEARENWSHCS